MPRPWHLVALGLAVWIPVVASSTSPRAQAQPQPTRKVEAGVYTAAQASRGEAVYNTACAACHGAALEGDFGPPLVGVSFLTFWNRYPLINLFDKVYTTMPVEAPRSLTREQAADVVAFMLSVSRFPAGSAELEADDAVLEQITFPSAPAGASSAVAP